MSCYTITHTLAFIFQKNIRHRICVTFFSLFFSVPANVPWNITWTKDLTKIVRTNGRVDYRKWAIIMEDLTEKDSGAYVCKVCNLHGCVIHTTQLQVHGKFNEHNINHCFNLLIFINKIKHATASMTFCLFLF